jgi:ADP-ribose pyrophosphatase YjhB (NUDIX family)
MDGDQPLEAGRAPEVILDGERARVRLPDLDYRSLLRPRRHGEVAMVVERAAGWILLQTKAHYPPGIFRLPTGTIHARESADAAMLRELHEEANLVPGTFRRICHLDYEIEGGRKDFFTDIYLIEAPQGQLRPNDAAEEINAWREAMVSELPAIAADLRRLEPPWQGWGIFRSVLHELVSRLLASRPGPPLEAQRSAELSLAASPPSPAPDLAPESPAPPPPPPARKPRKRRPR